MYEGSGGTLDHNKNIIQRATLHLSVLALWVFCVNGQMVYLICEANNKDRTIIYLCSVMGILVNSCRRTKRVTHFLSWPKSQIRKQVMKMQRIIW